MSKRNVPAKFHMCLALVGGVFIYTPPPSSGLSIHAVFLRAPVPEPRRRVCTKKNGSTAPPYAATDKRHDTSCL